jgi:hypothetical protein
MHLLIHPIFLQAIATLLSLAILARVALHLASARIHRLRRDLARRNQQRLKLMRRIELRRLHKRG